VFRICRQPPSACTPAPRPRTACSTPAAGCKENNFGDPAVECFACPITSVRTGFTANQVTFQCGEHTTSDRGAITAQLLAFAQLNHGTVPGRASNAGHADCPAAGPRQLTPVPLSLAVCPVAYYWKNGGAGPSCGYCGDYTTSQPANPLVAAPTPFNAPCQCIKGYYGEPDLATPIPCTPCPLGTTTPTAGARLVSQCA
jgi:hypothetical protein